MTSRAKMASLGSVWSLFARLLLGFLVGLFAGCGSSSSTTPTAPAGVTIQGESLLPVSGGICHMRGTVVNATPDVTVDVHLRWQAYDTAAQTLGTTAFTLTNVTPGTSQDFESTGFAGSDRLIACSEIARFERIETTLTPH